MKKGALFWAAHLAAVLFGARCEITGKISRKTAAAIEEGFRLSESEQEALIAEFKRAFRE